MKPTFALATIWILFSISNLAEQDAPKTHPQSSSASTRQTTATPGNGDYDFDGAISRKVLENYLDRSVTMAYFLVTGKSEGRREYPYHDDDVRRIKNIGAKFIGRAIYRWNGESRLNDKDFWAGAKTLLGRVHAHDPNVIFQGCLFETISPDVNQVPVPPGW